MTEAHADSIVSVLLGVKSKQEKPLKVSSSSGQEIITTRHINTRKRKPVERSS